MPELTTIDLTIEQLTIGLVAAAALALIAFLWVSVVAFKLHRLRKRATGVTVNGSGDGSSGASLGHSKGWVDNLEHRLDELTKEQEKHASVARFALQRFALVRYDAFEDMGGRLSFSAALLDDHGDGLVLTSINGRTETRTYAKPIEKMASSHNLSEEEREAIASAVAGQDRSETREIATQLFE